MGESGSPRLVEGGRSREVPGCGLAHVTPSKPGRCLCMTGRGESSGDVEKVGEGSGGRREVGVNAFQRTEDRGES